jgi:hypothetical protein
MQAVPVGSDNVEPNWWFILLMNWTSNTKHEFKGVILL